MNKRLFKTLLTSQPSYQGAVAAPVAAFAQDYDSLNGQSESQIETCILLRKHSFTHNQLALRCCKKFKRALQGNIQENDAAIASLKQKSKTQKAQLATRKFLADQARAVQATGGAENYVNVVASSKSVSDFVGRRRSEEDGFS